MAHFAKLDNDNNVIDVFVVDNNDILDEEGNESESLGEQFLQNLFQTNDRFVQTSYNHNFRGSYAQIDGHYDPDLDAFFHPQPFPSWLKNAESLQWEAPVPCPEPINENGRMSWDEENQIWEEYVIGFDDDGNEIWLIYQGE